VPVAVLELAIDALGRTRDLGGGSLPVVGMPQMAMIHFEQLLLAPSQNIRPGRIDAHQPAAEFGDSQKIVRDAPDAVAFADAFGDLRFQCVIQSLQRLFGALAVGDVDRDARQPARDVTFVELCPAPRIDPSERTVGLQKPVFGREDTIGSQAFIDLGLQRIEVVGVNLREEFTDRRTRGSALRVDRIKMREAGIGPDDIGAKIPVPGSHQACRVEGKLKPLLARAQCGFGAQALAGFHGGNENPADAGRRGRIRNRTVADREMRGLPVHPAPADRQRPVDREDAAVFPGQDILLQRNELGDDLRPYFAKRKPQGPGMLVGQDGPVSVIVDDDELRPPAQCHRKSGCAHDADDELKAWRPFFGWPQRGRRPVLLPDEFGHALQRFASSVAAALLGGHPAA
jgi:hypothetical protein